MSVMTLPEDLAGNCTLAEALETNTPEWEEFRRGGIGCSDLSAILGLNPWADRHTIWLNKVHGIAQPANWRMEIGHALEPIVRGIFQEREGVAVDECGLLQSKHQPWLRYTPDGLTSDGGLFEAKTTAWWSEDSWADDQVADHAEIQVQGGMAVTGRSHAWVAAMIDANPDRVHIRRVERDDEFIEQMLTVAESFWTNYVLTGVEPPLAAPSLAWVKDRYQPDPAVEVDLPAGGYRLLQELLAAKADSKAALKVAAEKEAQLRMLVGDAGVIRHGDSLLGTLKNVTTRRLDQKLLAEAGIDVEQYKTASTRSQFYWKKGVA